MVALCWPLFGAGQLSARDALTVATPVWSWDRLGVGPTPPRAVPQDALLTVVGSVTDAGMVVRIVLIAGLWVGATACGLLTGRVLGTGSRAVASAAAAASLLNPFVIGRLAQGQWSLVLGMVLLPAAVTLLSQLPAAHTRTQRVTLWGGLAVLCAGCALTPTPGLLLLLGGVVVLIVRWPGWRTASAALGLLLVANAPWLLAGIHAAYVYGTGSSDAAGTTAFAPAGTGQIPAWVAVLGGGGHWSVSVLPPSAHLPWALVTVPATACVVWLGVWVLARRSRLAAAAAASGVVLAVLLASLLGPTVHTLLADIPGSGLLRDGQKFAGTALLAYAVGAGWLIDRLSRWRLPPQVRPMILTAGVLSLLAVTVPDAAVATRATLTPQPTPAAAQDLARTIASAANRDPADLVVVVDSSLIRSYPELPQPVVDPLSLLSPQPVVYTRGLLIDGQEVDAQEGLRPQLVELAATGARAAQWQAAGVRWLIAADPATLDAAVAADTITSVQIHQTAGGVLVDLGGADPVRAPHPGWVAAQYVALTGYVLLLVTGLATTVGGLMAWRGRRAHGTVRGSSPR